MKKVFSILLAMSLLPVLLSSCRKEKPGCELLYKRTQQCHRKKADLNRSDFLRNCRETAEESGDLIACSTHRDCTAFKACMEEARKLVGIRRIQKRLDEALRKNDYKNALMLCDVHQKELSETSRKACARMLPVAFAELMKTATDLRDTSVQKEYRLCFELQEVAKKLGPDQIRAASLVCREMELQIILKKTLDEIGKRLATGKDLLPFQCMEQTIRKFDEVDSDFARARKKDLLEACYVRMGKLILEKQIPGMKDLCPHAVKEIYQAVRRHKLETAELEDWMRQASVLCEKP